MSLVFVLAVFLFIELTEQHFISVQDPCYLASVCNHTWMEECGWDKTNSQKKMFLDECDRYEHNCDYKKDFIKIKLFECREDKTTTKKITTTNATELTTNANELITNATNLITNATKLITNGTELTTSELMTPTESQHYFIENETTPMTTKGNTNLSEVTRTTPTVSSTTMNITFELCTRPLITNFTRDCNKTSTPMTTKEANLTTQPSITTTTIEGTTKTTAEATTPTKATLTTDSISTTISESTTTEQNITHSKLLENHTTIEIPCDIYPKDCDRPVTWETTPVGETRDFFQILKERFGRRAVVMKDTTHFPKSLGLLEEKDEKANFVFGNHIERRMPSTTTAALNKILT